MSKKTAAIALEWRNPKSLKPYEKNAKSHSAEQVAKIAEQIKAFGFDQPIVIMKNGTIIKGHGRRAAALLLGLEKVPVVISALTIDQARAARIGDNKVAESPWLNDFLRLELEAMPAAMQPLTGFDDSEFNAIIDGWAEAPLSKVDPDQEDPGLMARITVTCRQADRDRVSQVIDGALRASGISETAIK